MGNESGRARGHTEMLGRSLTAVQRVLGNIAVRWGSGFTGGATRDSFCDRVRLQVRGGRGGLGVVSFESEGA
jgi:hypothetical protein